jgi:hypothetical protein
VERLYRAAEQGDAREQFYLGGLLLETENLNNDYTEAILWFRKAAEQGHAWAQCCLGCAYFCGIGVPKDDKKAEIWYRKSIEQGIKMAQFLLDWLLDNIDDTANVYSEYEIIKEWGNPNVDTYLAPIFLVHRRGFFGTLKTINLSKALLSPQS